MKASALSAAVLWPHCNAVVLSLQDSTTALSQCDLSAAAAGGSAAFAQVAGPGRAHLGAAGHAQRCVGGLAQAQLQQLSGAAHLDGRGCGGRRTCLLTRVLLLSRRGVDRGPQALHVDLSEARSVVGARDL